MHFNKSSGDPGRSQGRNKTLEEASYVRSPPSLAFWLYMYERFLYFDFEYRSYHKDRLVASYMFEDPLIKYVDISKHSN